jgi:pimeloyl-ACP methyl ester carboxylesterase
MRKALWRTSALVAVLFAAVIVIVGPIWEQIESRRAAREFPAAGRLVDIGGRRIQLDCRGIGSPTVIFESGLGIDGSASWAKVHDDVAKLTRACAYSRAGIVWSDDKSGAHDGAGVARDLHATLEAAGEIGPFVLVGHSLGGPYITIFTKLFGDQVAGLVYVDAAHPDQVQRFEDALGKPTKFSANMAYRVSAAFPWTGVVRLGASLVDVAPSNAPTETVELAKAFASRSLGPMVQEMDALDVSFAQAGALRQLGARPTAVLTAMKPASEKLLKAFGMSKTDDEKIKITLSELHADMASWSSRGTHRMLYDASHYIQFDRPDAVIEAIRDVVESVRHGAAQAAD